MLVVSISPNAHDTSIAIADEDRVLLVLEAERPSRMKRKWCDEREIEHLVSIGLHQLGLQESDVSHWVGTAMMNVLLDLGDRRCDWVCSVSGRIYGRTVPFYLVNHHLAHAGLFFASPFDSAVIDACDGGGDGREHAAFVGRRTTAGGSIEPLDIADQKPFSAVFYDVLSYYVYRRYCQEGKLMGLAALGRDRDDMLEFLAEHASDLSIQTHEASFRRLHNRFPFESADWRDPVAQDLARNAQRTFERERVAQIAAVAQGAKSVVLTGGAALNIHANTEIAQQLAADVYVAPCCDDTGEALGALLYFMNAEMGNPISIDLPFLGMGTKPEPVSEVVIGRVVDDLLADRVVAWHWGRAEVGPRALGHRSLLSAPFTDRHRTRISTEIKGREPYRPVAPIVLQEQVADWFDLSFPSPYMLFAAASTNMTREKAPAVVHYDGSARIQTLPETAFDPISRILTAFAGATGVPILINTSLNGPGAPIANDGDDSLGFASRFPDVVPYIDGKRITRGAARDPRLGLATIE